jgi:hypothetical protein
VLRSLLFAVVVTAACLRVAPALHAHSGILNTARITFTDDAMLVNTEVALREILLVHGLRDEVQGGFDADAIAEAVNKHEQYITSHFEVRAGGEKLTGRVLETTPPAGYSSPSQTKYRFQLRYMYGDLKPAEVTLRQNMLREFSVTGGHPWHVTYLLGVKQADEKLQHVSLSPSQDLKLKTGLSADNGANNEVEDDSAQTASTSFTVEKGMTVPPGILLVLAAAAGVVAIVMALRQRRRDS